MSATWSSGLFDAARGCDIGRRSWAIRESSAMRIEVRRGASLVLLEGLFQPCGDEGAGRRARWDANETLRVGEMLGVRDEEGWRRGVREWQVSEG